MISIKDRNNAYVRKSRSKLSSDKKCDLAKYWIRSWKPYITRLLKRSEIEDKIKNRQFDLTNDFINDLLLRSDYKCCVTGLKLVHDISLYSMSIDRINSNIGHIINNIQLVNRGINLAKNNASNDDLFEFISCLKGKEFKPIKFSRDYISTMIRNIKLKDNKCNIDTDYVINMFNGQNGKCKLTGINMASYKHPMMSCSIDRIDNKIGHVIGNIQLVLKCINRAKGANNDDIISEWISKIRNIN